MYHFLGFLLLCFLSGAHSECLNSTVIKLPSGCEVGNLTLTTNSNHSIASCNNGTTDASFFDFRPQYVGFTNLTKGAAPSYFIAVVDRTANKVLWMVSNLMISNTSKLFPSDNQHTQELIAYQKPVLNVSTPHTIEYLVFEEHRNTSTSSLTNNTALNATSFNLTSWIVSQSASGVTLCGPVAGANATILRTNSTSILDRLNLRNNFPHSSTNYIPIPIPIPLGGLGGFGNSGKHTSKDTYVIQNPSGNSASQGFPNVYYPSQTSNNNGYVPQNNYNAQYPQGNSQFPQGNPPPAGFNIPSGSNLPAQPPNHGYQIPTGNSNPQGQPPNYGFNIPSGNSNPQGQPPNYGLNIPSGNSNPQGQPPNYGFNIPPSNSNPQGQPPNHGFNIPPSNANPQGQPPNYGFNIPPSNSNPQGQPPNHGFNIPPSNSNPQGQPPNYGLNVPPSNTNPASAPNHKSHVPPVNHEPPVTPRVTKRPSIVTQNPIGRTPKPSKTGSSSTGGRGGGGSRGGGGGGRRGGGRRG